MKKLLSLLALVLCFACGMRGEESHDYAVKTTKAPVWIYQDATSMVAGYLDYGAQPESEVDDDDPQWIHVKSGNLEGWSHILAFCHRASEPEDLDLANGALADFLRDAGVSQEVIDACTTGAPSGAGQVVQRCSADSGWLRRWFHRALQRPRAGTHVYLCDK